MSPHTVRMLAVCLVAVTLCIKMAYGGPSDEANGPRLVTSGPAQAATPAPAESPAAEATVLSPIEKLAKACGEAKGAFSPLTETNLREAANKLRTAASRLDATLRVAGPHSEGWRAYLDWSGLQEQLRRGAGPDLDALDAIYARYASGHNGLELSQFLEVRQALKQYLTTARAIGNPKIKEQYEALLDGLPERLKAYDADPTADEAHVIDASVRWLEEAQQAGKLVQAIRSHFSLPNGFVEMGADVIAAGMADTVDETGPVNEVILGTRVTGTEHTVGRITSELVPREDFAEISALLYATSRSNSVGVNGPARAESEGITQVAARKAIRIDAERVWTTPAKSNAIARSTMKSLTVSGGSMVRSRARQQAAAQKPEVERIVAQRAEQRTNRRLDSEAQQMIGDMSDDYQNKFRRPLLARNVFPQVFRVFSTTEAVHAVALQGGFSGLGVAEEPPELEGKYDLKIRMHESLLNNYTLSAWSGRIMAEETVRAQLTELLESTPTWLEPDEESPPWTISLARNQPLTFAFTDGGYRITLRGRQFERGDSKYPGMDVTAEYGIQESDGVVKGVRKGGLSISPPGGGKLSTREAILRSLLEKRFEKIFTPEMIPDPLVLPGVLEKAGELRLVAWKSADGWMLQGWNRIPESEKPAGEAPAAEESAGSEKPAGA